MEFHGADTQAQTVSNAIMSTVTTLERPFALNKAILACCPGGILSMPGVYAGPAGAIMVGMLISRCAQGRHTCSATLSLCLARS